MSSKNAKPVFLAGTNQIYPSYSAAAKALGISVSSVSRVVSGKVPSVKGHRLGALSARGIKVVETGQVFTSPAQAANALGVSKKKISSLVRSGSGATTGGYHFEYDVASSNGTHTQARQAGTTASKPKNRKQRKAEKRAKRQVKPERRATEREAKRKARELKRVIKQYDRTRESLYKYVKSVNDMSDKYPTLIYYHQAIKDVFSLQPLIGYGDDDVHFDDSLQEFRYDLSKDGKESIEELTKSMERILDRLITETTQKGKEFFDMTTAWQTRTTWANEFFKSDGHEDELDKYAHLIWDIILLLEEANNFEELGSDLLFHEIQDAMQGGIDPENLQKFMDDIDSWMEHHGDLYDLNEILEELHSGYTPKKGYSVYDDDGEWEEIT